jgi:Leucine-rich repeat (LRR) protein
LALLQVVSSASALPNSPATIGESPVSDRAALAAFFEATDGPAWIDSENWIGPNPLDEWHGVQTDDSGRVIAIELPGNGLRGLFSPEIAKLSRLRVLDLSQNQLHGAIPVGLGRIDLTSLNLASNDLSGSIPATLGEASGLEELNLSDNRLVAGIPRSFFGLRSLRYLNLSGNRLTDRIHGEFANFRALTFIDLSHNHFWGELPIGLGELTRLVEINVRGNSLGGQIPADLSRLPNLRRLGLGGNNLSGPVPAEIFGIPSLRDLDISDNALSWQFQIPAGPKTQLRSLELAGNRLIGPMPPTLARFAELEVLNVAGNRLTGPIPVSLLGMAELRVLDISDNRFSGPIPQWIGGLHSLAMLSAGRNQFTGPIPDLASLTKLVHLKLNGNQLSGSIPGSIAELEHLMTLDLSFNALYGPLPESLANLPAIRRLALGGNPLTGAIPSWLGDLRTLEELDLHSANLTAPIPDSLRALVKLRRIDLGGNLLTGPIPGWIGDLPRLAHLGLADNDLSGPIPTNLFSAGSLRELDLGRNRLDGELPDLFDRLPGLHRLHLNDNEFSGPIPGSMARLANLGLLRLDGNKLSGEIPAWLGGLSRVYELRLGRNRLNGMIPSDLGNLVRLRELELERNRLSGQIPDAFGLLVDLVRLNVSENRLDGPVPRSLGLLTDLQEVDLGNNRLSGQIPQSIANLAQMRSLDLARNRLSGSIPDYFSEMTVLRELNLGGNNFQGCAPNSIRSRRFAADPLGIAGLPFCDLALSRIALSSGEIRPGFESSRRDYVAYPGAIAETGIVTIQLFAFQELQAVAFRDATGKILADADQTNAGFQLDLGDLNSDGEPALLRIDVIAGELVNQYRVWFKRALPSDAGLFAILVDDFPVLANAGPGRFGHQVAFERDRLTIEPLPWNPAVETTIESPRIDQSVPGIWELDLAVGETSLMINTTSANRATMETVGLHLERLAPERETLIQFFESTGGPGWINGAGWLSDSPLEDWYGITTDGAGRVVEIDLWANGMTGSIPESIGDLAHLQRLDLRQNLLSGQIPSSLGRLSELLILDLSENQLTGPLPSELLQLPKVLFLQLDGNRLSGPIPNDFAQGQNLIGLGLAENGFDGPFPESIGRLEFLGTLRLFGNKFEGCLPRNLRNRFLQFHDFARLKIPFCDTGLQDLKVLAGTLVPEFSPGNYRYRLLVDAGGDADVVAIAPKPFGSEAAIAFLGSDSVPVIDLDPQVDGLQLDLSQLDFSDGPFELNIAVTGIGSEQGYTLQIEQSSPGDTRIDSIGILGFASSFSPGSYYLRRWVGHAENRVTIDVRKFNPAASLEFFAPPVGQRTLRPLPDADGIGANGFQADLEVGPNILLLKVGADGSDPQIYVLVIVREPGPPSRPTTGGVRRDEDFLELHWMPPPGDGGDSVTSYEIRYIYAAAPRKPAEYWTLVSDIPANDSLSRSIQGLEALLTYEIQIRAYNGAGAGPWSNSIAA